MVEVKLSESTISLPTYEPGAADIEPPLIDEFTPRGAPVYPYRTLEKLGKRKCDREYRAVFLENDYLKLTILPELNGRLYSAFDKVNRHELFYANPVIKPGLFAVRGAWPAVGVEFNFPNSHTTTTLDEVSCAMREYDDGSAAVVVGDIECTCRMGWSVEIKLSPDSSAIAMESRLYNPTELPQRFYYWINAACPVFAETEFVFPPSTRRLLTHPPMDASRLAYLDWPRHQGRDINYFKNINQHFPVFAEEMHEDFYGIYHHHLNYGLAHVADCSLVRGRKLWMFGNARDGRIFIDLLSDDHADYCELQTGPFTLQSDYRLLHPGRMHVQRDYWLPVAATGGFNHACREFAARIDDDGKSFEVALCASAKLENFTAEVRKGDRVIDVYSCNVQPGNAVKFQLNHLPDSEIRFIDGNGRQLSVYQASRPDIPKDAGVARNPNHKHEARNPKQISISNFINDKTITEHQDLKFKNDSLAEVLNKDTRPVAVDADHAFLRGKYLEEQGRRNAAEAVYRQAADNDLAAKLAAARLAVGNGRNERAGKLLSELLAVDRNNAEALLLAGDLDMRKADFAATDKAFSRALDDNRFRDRALFALACSAVCRRDYRRALDILREASECGAAEANVHALTAFCQRKLALNTDGARLAAEKIFFQTPLLLGENCFSAKQSHPRPELALEAACVYIRLCHFEDALQLLLAGTSGDGAAACYLIAWLLHRLGREQEAVSRLATARQAEWREMFAFRNEFEPVLRYALSVAPKTRLPVTS